MKLSTRTLVLEELMRFIYYYFLLFMNRHLLIAIYNYYPIVTLYAIIVGMPLHNCTLTRF